MVRKLDFDASVALPPGLDTAVIGHAINKIEKYLADFVDVYYEQGNVFRVFIAAVARNALDTHSVYE